MNDTDETEAIVAKHDPLRADVLDHRLTYIMDRVQDALDNAAVNVHAAVENEAAKGPLTGAFAVAKWYELLAIRGLRRQLARTLKGRGTVQKGL